MTPTTPLEASFTAPPPHPIHHPCPPQKILIVHLDNKSFQVQQIQTKFRLCVALSHFLENVQWAVIVSSVKKLLKRAQ